MQTVQPKSCSCSVDCDLFLRVFLSRKTTATVGYSSLRWDYASLSRLPARKANKIDIEFLLPWVSTQIWFVGPHWRANNTEEKPHHCPSFCLPVLPPPLREAAAAVQPGRHASHSQENLQGAVRPSSQRLNDRLSAAFAHWLARLVIRYGLSECVSWPFSLTASYIS